MLHITITKNGKVICDKDCDGVVAAAVKQMQEKPGVITHDSDVIVVGNRLACTYGYKLLIDHPPEELEERAA